MEKQQNNQNNPVLDRLRSTVFQKIELQKDKINLQEMLSEHKEKVLENLVSEQNFRISLNSVDPKILSIKQMFNEMNEFLNTSVNDIKKKVK